MAIKSKPKYEIRIENFNGIDLRNSPSKVAFNRSPMCPNMIRETKGNNRKRHGYETLYTLDAPINGFHTLKTATEKVLVHANTKLYVMGNPTPIYTLANNQLSLSRQVGGKLYIFDGANFLVYDGTTVAKVEDSAYIPTATIAKTYKGGGTSLEPLNLIQPKRTERFTGDATNKTFPLGYTNIDAATVVIKSLNSSGGFDTLVEGTHFTVNRTLGTFTTSTTYPTPVTGEDNLYVTYAKTVTGYADRVKKCTICFLYGLNGQRDRIFASGNADYPNYDWYCKSNDPTMWGDTWYCVIGQEDSKIMGYSIVNDYLVTHKDKAENDSNANLRQGSFDSTNGTVFKSTGSYSAAGALSKYAFVSFQNEPLYLSTEKSIHAITPSDVLGERSSQERSYFISSALANEDLTDAYACYYDGFYMIATGTKVYILDSTQIVMEENRPYSTRQYESYLLTGIGAKVLFVYDDRLYFGTSDGKVKRFFNTDSVQSFYDDGYSHEVTTAIDGVNSIITETFPCYWDTCEIYGTKEELKKTFKHIATCLNAYTHTGCRIYAKTDGEWHVVFDYDGTANYFDFTEIVFSQLDFSFRTDRTPTIIGGKCREPKLLHIQLRFENNRPQPFSILWAKLKYTLGGEYVK